MTEREAMEVIRMVESYYQFDFGRDTRELWKTELVNYDPVLAVRAAAWMAGHPLPNHRNRPQLHDYRAVYLKIAKDEEVKAQGPALPVSPMRRPDWVVRWERARAAGDQRPFPEQAPGYEALRRMHPMNRAAYALPHVAHSSREHWVQPDEYVAEHP